MTKRLFMPWAMLLCLTGVARGQAPCVLDAQLTAPGSDVIADTTNPNLPGNSYTIYGNGLGANPANKSFNWAIQGITQYGTFVDFDISTTQTSLSIGANPTSGFVLNSGNTWVFLTSTANTVTFWAAIVNGSSWTVTTVGVQTPVTFPYTLDIQKRGRQYTGYLSRDGGGSWLSLGTYTASYNWDQARAVVGLIAYSGDNINLSKSTYSNVQYIPVINGQYQYPWQNFAFIDQDKGTVGVTGGGGITQNVTISDIYNAQAQLFVKPVPPNTTCSPNDPLYLAVANATMQFQSNTGLDTVNDVPSNNILPNTVYGPTYTCQGSLNGTCTASMSVTNTFNIGDQLLYEQQYDQLSDITLFAYYQLSGHPGTFQKVIDIVRSVKEVAATTAQVISAKDTTTWYVGPTPDYNCPSWFAPPDFKPSVMTTIPPPAFTPLTGIGASLCFSSPNRPGWNCTGGPAEPIQIAIPKALSYCTKHTAPDFSNPPI